MAVESNNSSISGYLAVVGEEQVSPTFTDVELYARSGHSILLRAKRYGQWWMLKGLDSESAEVGVYNQMLKKEFDILIRMQHPGIVHASEMVTLSGEFAGAYIVMEWLDGMDWNQWAREPHTTEEKLNVCRQLFDAVAYVHSQGVVHRDLKPENIIITHNGNYLRIIDFGLSDSEFFSILKQPAGTVGYMSPEQQTQSVADVRNDLYSLGVLMERLDLPRRYRPVLRRCKGPIDRRYPNITLLRRAFDAAGSRPRFPWLIALMLLLTLAAALLLITPKTDPQPQEIQEVPQAAPAQAPEAESPEAESPASESPAPPNSPITPNIPNPPKAAEAAPSRLQEAIDDGLALIEAECKKIDLQLDTLSNPIYHVDYSGPFDARDDFYYHQATKYGLTEDEYDRLYFILGAHINDRHIQWYKQLKALEYNE